MLVLRIVAGVALGYGLIVLLAWLLQERLAVSPPPAPGPGPRPLGIANGERLQALGGGGGRVRAPGGSGRGGRPPHPRVRPLARYRGGELHRGPAPRGGSHPRVTVHERRRDGASPVPLPAAARPAAIARQPRARQAGALSRPAAPRHRRPARPDGDGHGGGGRGGQPG